MSLTAALRERDVAQLPGRRDEDWRWTDLRGLLRVLPPPSPAMSEVADSPALAGVGAPTIVFANGRQLEDGEVAIPPTGRGVFVRRFVSATTQTSHHVEASAEVGAGATLVLVDSFEGRAYGYVSDASTPIRVGEGATLERIVLLDDAAEAVSVNLTEVELAPGAAFRQTVLASGAKRQRFETRVRHLGGGASLQLDGLYLLGDRRHSDQTTVVDHTTTDGTTSQLTKGVVTGRSRGVFQGRIVVAHGADRTDARMGHHALMLSEQAEVDAKPELEIYADDVQCAHGNTIGAIDEDALFYIRSRGVPEAEARALLVEAFLGEVTDRITYEPARELARTWMIERLGALS
jgi:Fe-S cluster assembly protein SufD